MPKATRKTQLVRKQAEMRVEARPARIVIENVRPEIQHGRYPAKGTVGEKITVEADVFADGHDALRALLLYRREAETDWRQTPMEHLGNDRWGGKFPVTEIGPHRYTIAAWIDHFETWRRDLQKRANAGQYEQVALLVGAQLIEQASARAANAAAQRRLNEWARALRADGDVRERYQLALDERLAQSVSAYPDRRSEVRYAKELLVVVDREKARFSAWYEMFPRSCANELGTHGTFKDCEARLPYIADMGFDVLYFPPIHPIGSTHRKGKNNSPTAAPDDPGSPWGIGSAEGGHMSLHPQLGTLKDFRHLVKKANECGIEIALDLAYQCSPDHPYVRQHPEWFRWRPDGRVQYAENPPKKYEDIYPLDFETEPWQPLWEELKNIVLFWIQQGVRIFRVDNPHTKPFRFWEWLIGEIKNDYADVIFLAEAFTRPKVMYQLAQAGFTQSYTYFAWRNAKWELEQYLTELTQTEVRDFFRPNLWTNTPDILTEYLQVGGRPAFMTRLVLAATLGASYGIYGPAFELCENRARESGSEEYLNSEKYEVKHWEIDAPGSLKDIIARVNQIRRENAALQNDWSLRFHRTDNEQLICYSKHSEDGENIILVVVNLDPHYTQSGWIDLSLEVIRFDVEPRYQVHDLLTDARYIWNGGHNYVQLDLRGIPAHIFRVRRRVRTEHDFDYYA